MSPIPSTLKICDRVYTVTIQPMGAGAIGACNNINQDITIEADMHPETQSTVLLHEVIEAVNASMNLDMEHATITALETALYSVLTSNEPWWGLHVQYRAEGGE